MLNLEEGRYDEPQAVFEGEPILALLSVSTRVLTELVVSAVVTERTQLTEMEKSHENNKLLRNLELL